MQISEKRYFLIDSIRGFTAINMVVFHFLYDVYIVYKRNLSWYRMPAIYIWQQGICWTFIFISGFVWPWGMKKNLRRGLQFNFYGFMISIITLLFVPSETIWFGILNFIGCAVLILLPLQEILKKIPPAWGLTGCFLLFLFSKNIQFGYLGGSLLGQIELPLFLYSVKILTPLGFPFPGFCSSDYFPLLPWIFLYLCGYFFNKLFMKYAAWQRVAVYKIPFLSYIGSRTLWIYILHQPVIFLLCSLIGR